MTSQHAAMIAQLQEKIRQCRAHKATVKDHVAKLRATHKDKPRHEREHHIQCYLGDKSYEEWMLLYDAHIRESKDELRALTTTPSSTEQAASKKTLMAAGAITVACLLILALIFLPTPVAVLTGNVLGFFTPPTLADTLLDDDARTNVHDLTIRVGNATNYTHDEVSNTPYDARLQYNDTSITLYNQTPTERITVRYEPLDQTLTIHEHAPLDTYAITTLRRT